MGNGLTGPSLEPSNRSPWSSPRQTSPQPLKRALKTPRDGINFALRRSPFVGDFSCRKNPLLLGSLREI